MRDCAPGAPDCEAAKASRARDVSSIADISKTADPAGRRARPRGHRGDQAGPNLDLRGGDNAVRTGASPSESSGRGDRTRTTMRVSSSSSLDELEHVLEVPRDRNRVADVYLHDVHTGQTTLVSRSARGGSATGPSRHPALSADGRFVAFVSDASDLGCAGGLCPNHSLDLNLVADVYLFDTLTHALTRMSGARARLPWWEVSTGPSLDAAGRVIAFSSRHPIDPSDVKHDFDLFVEEIPVVRERTDPSGALRPR